MHSKFSQRSSQLEFLDAHNIPKQLLFQNLHELDFINRTLGGHSISLTGIKKLITDKNKVYHIVDIGCGGGDAMKVIAQYARKNNFKLKITGVDSNANAIEYLQTNCSNYPEITGVVYDYKTFLNSQLDIDIVHCSLFCHHLNDDALVELFHLMKFKSKTGFVINDLQRHPLAYYGIRLLTQLLKGSTLVKNDAPLSVLRGFKKPELIKLLSASQIKEFEIKWKWAFRYLIVHKTYDT